MENFSFDKEDQQKVEERLGIKIDEIEKLNLREDFIVTLKSGEVKHVPLSEIEDVARPACFACTDFTNDFADISVGGVGSPENFTTTIVRTKEGEEIYSEARRFKYIEELKTCADEELIEKYKSLDCLEKINKLAEHKRKRGQETLEKLRTRRFELVE